MIHILKSLPAAIEQVFHDADRGALVEPGPPGSHALWVLGTSGLCLLGLNFVVLDPSIQASVAHGLAWGMGVVDRGHTAPPGETERLLRHLVWAGGCLTFYLVIPGIVTRFALHRALADFGLTRRGYLRHAWIYLSLFLPVGVILIFVSRAPAFQWTYPFYRNPASGSFLLAWEMAYAAQFVGLEFFFRGFMLHGLRPRYGSAALWIMVIPYGMIHFTKPWPEAMGAFLAGTVLGLLSLRTKSVLGGASIHIAVAWSMDLLSLWHKGALGHLF